MLVCEEWLVQSAILSLLLQFNLGFILTKLERDLFIIDQVSQLAYLVFSVYHYLKHCSFPHSMLAMRSTISNACSETLLSSIND